MPATVLHTHINMCPLCNITDKLTTWHHSTSLQSFPAGAARTRSACNPKRNRKLLCKNLNGKKNKKVNLKCDQSLTYTQAHQMQHDNDKTGQDISENYS